MWTSASQEKSRIGSKFQTRAVERNPFNFAPLQNQSKTEEEWSDLNLPHHESVALYGACIEDVDRIQWRRTGLSVRLPQQLPGGPEYIPASIISAGSDRRLYRRRCSACFAGDEQALVLDRTSVQDTSTSRRRSKARASARSVCFRYQFFNRAGSITSHAVFIGT